MKSKLLALVSITLALTLAALDPAAAQHTDSPAAGTPAASGSTRTDGRILYHNGPVMEGTSAVYFIWYGCWGTVNCGQSGDPYIQAILIDFASNLGSSPYFLINAGYPNAGGRAPNGALIYGGSVGDQYSRGPTLSEADVAAIVADQMKNGGLPLDTAGIYVVLTSADVTVVDGDTQFCVTCCQLHGTGLFLGSTFKYVFVGNPRRCPSSCAAEYAQPSPNDNTAGDAMASWLAYALNATVTNPTGTGWYDRNGLENSEKCEGTFGTTYPAQNGGPANVRLGQRDFLLQQNWVNGRKGHCAMSYLQ